jgi:hypothetical protein
VRDRITFNITDSGTGGQVLGLGCFGPVGGGAVRMPMYGSNNTYANAFWTSNGLRVPFNLSGADLGRVRLSKLLVRIVSQVPSTGFLPSGMVYTTCLPTNIDFGAFTNSGDLAGWCKNRVETRTHTAVRALDGINLTLLPNDLLDNASLSVLGGYAASGTTYLPDPSWGNIVVCLDGANSGGTTYTFTVHAEWSVEYTADPVKVALHSLHPSSPPGHWAHASRSLQESQGLVSSLEAGIQHGGEIIAGGAAAALGLARGMLPLAEPALAAAPLMAMAMPPRRRRAVPKRRPAPRRAPPRRRRR